MVMEKLDIEQPPILKDERLENVSELKYLVSLIKWNGDCSEDIRRIEKACRWPEKVKPIFHLANLFAQTHKNVETLPTCSRRIFPPAKF